MIYSLYQTQVKVLSFLHNRIAKQMYICPLHDKKHVVSKIVVCTDKTLIILGIMCNLCVNIIRLQNHVINKIKMNCVLLKSDFNIISKDFWSTHGCHPTTHHKSRVQTSYLIYYWAWKIVFDDLSEAHILSNDPHLNKQPQPQPITNEMNLKDIGQVSWNVL